MPPIQQQQEQEPQTNKSIAYRPDRSRARDEFSALQTHFTHSFGIRTAFGALFDEFDLQTANAHSSYLIES